MRLSSFVPLVAVIFSLSGHCLPSTSNDGPVTLLPINLGDFEGRQGIQRRADADFSALDPSTHAQLVYGNKGGEESLTFQNSAKLTTRRERPVAAGQHDSTRSGGA